MDDDLLAFTRQLIAFRSAHPVFSRRRWFQGRAVRGTKELRDIGWFTPEGDEMTDEDWQQAFAKSLGVFLNGDAITSPDMYGEKVVDDTFFLLFNAHHEPIRFTLPSRKWAPHWIHIFDSADGGFLETGQTRAAGGKVWVEERSLALLKKE